MKTVGWIDPGKLTYNELVAIRTIIMKGAKKLDGLRHVIQVAYLVCDASDAEAIKAISHVMDDADERAIHYKEDLVEIDRAIVELLRGVQSYATRLERRAMRVGVCKAKAERWALNRAEKVYGIGKEYLDAIA